MTLSDWGAIGSIIAGFVALVGLVSVVIRFVHKVYEIEQRLYAPLIVLTPSLVALYRKAAISLFNPDLQVEKEDLLDKLGGTENLTPTESNRLKQMLKDELAEARHKGQQDAVLAISTMIILVRLLTKKQR